MVRQVDALELVREHPDLSVPELADLKDWGDLSRVDNYIMRKAYMRSLISKLYKLQKFGMVERGYDKGRTTWRVKE